MGGIARYCQDIMGSKLAEDFDLTFFPVTIPQELRPAAYTGFVDRGQVNLFARDGVLNTVRQLAFCSSNMREYRDLLRREKFDVVHIPSCTGWGYWRNALFVYYAKRYGVKVLWHVVGAIDEFWIRGSKVSKFLIQHTLDWADLIVLQSKGLRRIVSKFTSTPIQAIYNGVRTEELVAPDRYAHSDPDDGKIRVVTLGVLGKRKGYLDLIPVARQLQDKIPQLEFVFIGGGEIEKIRGLVADEDLEDRITVAGLVDDDQRVRLLQTSDIFALPTYAEGQPIALLEAMAAGLPVISTPVGSIDEVVHEANGRLITPGDQSALAEAITELSSSADLRRQIGSHNAQDAEVNYSIRRVMREFGEVYKRMAALKMKRAM